MKGAAGPPVVALLIGRAPEERYSVHRGYVDAVYAAGGVPVLIAAGPGADPGVVAGLMSRVDAVISSGGGDIDPSHYAAAPETAAPETAAPETAAPETAAPETAAPETAAPEAKIAALMDVDIDRDRVEIAVVRAAIDGGRRVLGICRGAQLLAVATGGSLIHDVASAGYHSHWEEERQYEPVHGIKAEPGSLADRALSAASTVNSIHHQAVADPGPLLRPTAWAPDGLIEAVEGSDVLGVQWHPERLVSTERRHLAPFQWAVHG